MSFHSSILGRRLSLSQRGASIVSILASPLEDIEASIGNVVVVVKSYCGYFSYLVLAPEQEVAPVVLRFFGADTDLRALKA